MTRTRTATTLSPTALAAGAPVLAEHALEVLRQTNWSHARRPVLHVSVCCADDGWETGAVGPLRTLFPVDPEERLRFCVQIDPDVQTIQIGAACYFAASNTGTVTVVVGSATRTLSFAAADNGSELVAYVSTLESGTGWQLCTVTLDRTAGAGTGNYLRTLRIEDEEPQVLTPFQETLTSEAITGTDTALADTLTHTPLSSASVLLFLNGQLMRQGAGADYSISGSTITWLASSGTAPDLAVSDELVAAYWYAG